MGEAVDRMLEDGYLMRKVLGMEGTTNRVKDQLRQYLVFVWGIPVLRDLYLVNLAGMEVV